MARYEVTDHLFLWYLGDPKHPQLVGELQPAREFRGVSLNYSDNWLATGFALSKDLPLKPGTYMPTEKETAPGAVDDARPDRWGERVIRQVERPPRISLMEFLYFAGDDRFGALGVSTSRTEYLPHSHGLLPTFDDVTQVQAAALKILEKEPLTEMERRLACSGGSMGGAQPKAILQHGGRQWVVKFTGGADIDKGLVEHATMTLAAKAGITVPQTMPLRVPDGHAFAVERFDREGERRIHTLSAHTVLRAGEEDYGYPQLAQWLRRYVPADERLVQSHELFRRMVFNILVANTDDHERNHAVQQRGDHFCLAPAYDLIPSRVDEIAQQMVVGRNGRESTIENALSMADAFALKRTEAEAEARKVAGVVATWKQHFMECGVTKGDIESLEPHIDSAHLLEQRAQYVTHEPAVAMPGVSTERAGGLAGARPHPRSRAPQQPEDPVEKGRRLVGHIAYDDLAIKCSLLQDMVSGRHPATPAEVAKARDALQLITPYYEVAKQEHEAGRTRAPKAAKQRALAPEHQPDREPAANRIRRRLADEPTEELAPTKGRGR